MIPARKRPQEEPTQRQVWARRYYHRQDYGYGPYPQDFAYGSLHAAVKDYRTKSSPASRSQIDLHVWQGGRHPDDAPRDPDVIIRGGPRGGVRIQKRKASDDS